MPKSLFETEAERIALLNKFKKKDDVSLSAKLVGWTVGIGLCLVIFLAIFIPTSIYFVLAHGFVLTKLWGWFIVPLGAPALTVLHAAGIIGLVRLCTYNAKVTPEKEDVDWTKKVLHFIMLATIPWVSLFFGYVIHRFM